MGYVVIGYNFLFLIVYHNFKSRWSKGGCSIKSDLEGWTRVLSLWNIVALLSFCGSVVMLAALLYSVHQQLCRLHIQIVCLLCLSCPCLQPARENDENLLTFVSLTSPASEETPACLLS